ncbi:GDSL-type esterase/lipase family protein [Streptomyces albidoflavus]|uniref:SGNH/GDSL hydrolase family protein n=1 Tax=Streptomyces albidoflavus TaxID=1886 RepID=UPI0033AFCE28
MVNPPDAGTPRPEAAWFGHSLMAQGGYPASVMAALSAARPERELSWTVYARGGATSRDVRAQVEAALGGGAARFGLAFVGAGVNDVWRRFQGRAAEAVGLDEFREQLGAALRLLAPRSRRLVCVGDPPMGWAPEPGIPVAEFNAELCRYNAVAAEEAARVGARFADLYAAFTGAPESAPGAGPLWSDGVHLSPAGDAVAHRAVLAVLGGPAG